MTQQELIYALAVNAAENVVFRERIIALQEMVKGLEEEKKAKKPLARRK